MPLHRATKPSSKAAVTFVVPVFDKAAYLGQCLESVRRQTLRNTEIICVNDASTDRSGEILEAVGRLEPRLRVVTNQRNLGAAASRNIGINMANGHFIRFVDADDLLPVGSTEVMYERALDTGADVVRGSLALFRGDDPDNVQSVVSVSDQRVTTLRTERSLWVPWWHTSYLLSLELLRRDGLRYPALLQGEDPVFLASVLVRAERVSLIEDIVYLYRKYPKSTGSAGSTYAAVNDLLEHAMMVKSLFTSYFADCWYEGYGPYLLDDFRKVLRRCKLGDSQMELVSSRAQSIWESYEALG